MRALLAILAFAVYFAIAPASDAGWPSSGRVYPPSGGGVACSQATTFLARTSGLSGTQTSAYTALICGMVTDGTWSVMDGLYVFATASTATANLNLVSTSYGLTQYGTVTFSANAGYTGDGITGFFDTGFNPSTAGGHMAANSASLGVCDLTYRVLDYSNEIAMGGYDGSDDSYILPGYTTSGGTYFFLNGSTSVSASTNSRGSWAISTTSSLTGYVAQNGVTSSYSPTNSNVVTHNLYVSALDYVGSAAYYSADQLAYTFFGGGLTSVQMTAIYNRLHTYLATVGAPSGC